MDEDDLEPQGQIGINYSNIGPREPKNPDLPTDLVDIVNLYAAKLITKAEARKILQTYNKRPFSSLK